MEVVLIVLAVGLLAFVALECYNALSAGGSLMAAVYRFVRSKVRGSRYIQIPEDLVTPIANQLVNVGSELIVGDSHEWQDIRVVRYAILPGQARQEAGTVLRVDSIGSDLIEVRRL